MQEAEVTQFLTHLAVDRKVTASTQNQTLSALLFLYCEVLKRDLNGLEVPVVLTRDEVRAVLNHISGEKWMMASLLYGAGRRLMECLIEPQRGVRR